MSLPIQGAEGVIREYCALQASLCAALLQNYPTIDRNFNLDCPKRGSIRFEGNWSFQRHGLGVAFTNVSDGVVVDAHTEMFACSNGLDAWRLATYLESLRVVLTHRGKHYSADEDILVELLEQLVSEGILTPIGIRRDKGLYAPV